MNKTSSSKNLASGVFSVPGPNEWVRFCARDCLALEAAYRLHESDIVQAWWNEVAERTAPTPQPQPLPTENPPGEVLQEQEQNDDGENTEDAAVPQLPPPPSIDTVVVRGGLYEVDVFAGTCSPRYWDGPAHSVLRSTWFAQPSPSVPRIPLPQPLCETLEAAYTTQPWRPAARKASFQPDGTFGARIDLCESAMAVDPGPAGGSPYTAALFCNPAEAYLCRDASIGERIKGALGAHKATPGLPLIRGFVPPPPPPSMANDASASAAANPGILQVPSTPPRSRTPSEADAPPPPTTTSTLAQPPASLEDASREAMEHLCGTHIPSHLIFAVHGIGQMMKGNDIEESANELRSGLHKQWLAERDAAYDATYRARRKKQLSHADAVAAALDAADRIGRVEVLPVQWRKNTSLEGEWLQRICAPPGARSIRDVINSTVTDVVWYLTPAYRARFQRSLATAMASLHSRFLAVNPYFDGGVSICAHSLGTVIVHDVLSQQVGSVRPFNYGEEETTTSTEIAEEQEQEQEQQKAAASSPQKDKVVPSSVTAEPEAIGQQLPFKCRCFILLGSPLSCFLTMRGGRIGATLDASALAGAPFIGAHGGASFTSDHAGADAAETARSYLSTARPAEWVMMHSGRMERADKVCRLPVCTRMLNVYHPNDPVAYRMEPLVASQAGYAHEAAEAAAARRSVYVPYHKGGNRHVGVSVTEMGESMSTKMNLTLGALGSFFSSRKKAPGKPSEKDKAKASKDSIVAATVADEAAVAAMAAECSEAAEPSEPPSAAFEEGARRAEGAAMDRLGGRSDAIDPYKGRLDFVLQDALINSELLSAATAHFAYWDNPDVARFVLRAVHRVDSCASLV